MLTSYTSRVLASVLGIIYPAYASFKALESKETIADDQRWLTYWVVYAVVAVFEDYGEQVVGWVPLYYELKLMLFIWLVLPQTRGSLYVYEGVALPDDLGLLLHKLS